MSTAGLSFDTLIQDALRLPVEGRSRMTSRLIESLDEDIEISPAWREELDRRIEAVGAGLGTYSHEQVMAEARSLLGEARQQKQTAG